MVQWTIYVWYDIEFQACVPHQILLCGPTDIIQCGAKLLANCLYGSFNCFVNWHAQGFARWVILFRDTFWLFKNGI